MPKASHVPSTSTPNRRSKAKTKAPPGSPAFIRLSRYPLCPNYDIWTVFGLIEAFGGLTPFAEELGVAEDEVKAWAISGSIPTGWHLRLFARVCARGETISPSIFGFRDDDEAGQALARLMHDARLARTGGDDA